MSKYSETILTANGLDLATRAANGKLKFALTRAAATSDDLSKMKESDLQNLTALPNERQAGVITNQDENIPNSTAVVGTEILFTNEGISEGYSINGVGLYAKEEGKDEEILYAVNTAVEPEFMPDFADKVIMQFKITMYVIVGRTENVTVIVDPTGMASKEYVQAEVAKIDVNDKIQNVDIDNQLLKRLAYTDYKSEGMNKATQIAEVVGKMPIGLKNIDKDGNVTPILPDADGLITVPGNSSGTSDDGDDPEHPSAGIDYYAGSLANGEITDRYVAYQTPTNPTSKTNVKFSMDVGNTLNRVGTGLQYLIYLQKTTITKGIIGTSTKVLFNYDPNNISKSGTYTTTAPIPMYTKAESYEVGKPNTVIFDGVGENLGLTNHKSPGLTLTFKADKTMDIEPIQGFDNDGSASGVTGFTYDIVVEVISTYNVQTAVQQLPPAVNLFTGSANGNVVLSGSSNFFENLMDGITITLDSYFYHVMTVSNSPSYTAYPSSVFGISTVKKIDKEHLINGLKIKINTKNFSGSTPIYEGKSLSSLTKSQGTGNISDGGGYYITLQSGSIDLSTNLYEWKGGINGGYQSDTLDKLRTTRITTYKN